jgi:molybdopterin-guanine dinucleotide biosynthesis protein
MGQLIRVMISGSTKAGKTTIAELIVRTLRKVGVRCETPEPGVMNLQDHVAALNAAQTQVTVVTTGGVKSAPATGTGVTEIVTPLVALRAQQAALEQLLAERGEGEASLDPAQHPAARALQLGAEAIRKLESGR